MTTLEVLRLAYLSHVTLPIGKIRFNRQHVMSALRDAIADIEGVSAESIQNEFAEIAANRIEEGK